MTPSLHAQTHDAIQESIRTDSSVLIEPQTDSDFGEIHDELLVWMADDCEAFMDDDGIYTFWHVHPNLCLPDRPIRWKVRVLHPKAARVQD